MLRVLVLIVMALVPLSVLAQSASPDPVDFRLDAHRWEHRLLVVFAPSVGDERLATQEERFAGHDDGFRDRDLLLLTIGGPAEGTLRTGPGTERRPLTEDAIERLYDHFDVSPDRFWVALVGKDGTEKRRDAEPVRTRSIFDTIDAMPMRQREMRESDG